MESFIVGAVASLIISLVAILASKSAKITTQENGQIPGKQRMKFIGFFCLYIFTFFISIPIGYICLLVAHVRKKRENPPAMDAQSEEQQKDENENKEGKREE